MATLESTERRCRDGLGRCPSTVGPLVENPSVWKRAPRIFDPLPQAFFLSQPRDDTVGAAVPSLLRGSGPSAVRGFVAPGVVSAVDGETFPVPMGQGPLFEGVEVVHPLIADGDVGIVGIVSIPLAETMPDFPQSLCSGIGSETVGPVPPGRSRDTISLQASTGSGVAVFEAGVEHLKGVATAAGADHLPDKVLLGGSVLESSEDLGDGETSIGLSDGRGADLHER